MKIYIERIIGIIFVICGISLIVYGNYEKLQKENKELDNNETENKENIKEDTDFEEIVSYLKNKYNSDFEIIEKVKEYCLDVNDYNLSYSDNCSSKSVINTVYKAKSIDDDIEFYIKEVYYDEASITIPDSEKSNETKGFYDNYISYIIKKKIEDSLITEYEKVFDSNVSLSIYEGIGIYGTEEVNALQYLDNSTQDIKDTNIEVSDFLDLSNDLSLGILIKRDNIVDENNFKEEVDFVFLAKEIKLSGVFIDTLLIEYNNDNRYIKYDNDLKILELKSGTNKYLYDDSVDVYERNICLNNEHALNCIIYDEFKLIDSENIIFQ